MAQRRRWGYGERSEDRENSRNGYRRPHWDTCGHIRLGDADATSAGYSPDSLLMPRRGEQADW